MFSKIKNILTYYDSEPTEITQAFIWLVLFPIIYTAEFGLNILLVLVSISLGLSGLYSTCYHSLKTRKQIALAAFVFSTVVCTMYAINGSFECPTQWGWIIVSISALFNTMRVCNHYYKELYNG